MLLALLVSVALAGPDVPLPDEDVARICFARTYNLVGSAIPYHVHADDRPLGKLANRRYFCVDAEPGSYQFTVKGTFISSTGGSFTDVGGTPVYIPSSQIVHVEREGLIQVWGGQLNWLQISQPSDTFEVEERDDRWAMKQALRPARKRQVVFTDPLLRPLVPTDDVGSAP